jgi:hypothetical protein
LHFVDSKHQGLPLSRHLYFAYIFRKASFACPNKVKVTGCWLRIEQTHRRPSCRLAVQTTATPRKKLKTAAALRAALFDVLNWNNSLSSQPQKLIDS